MSLKKDDVELLDFLAETNKGMVQTYDTTIAASEDFLKDPNLSADTRAMIESGIATFKTGLENIRPLTQTYENEAAYLLAQEAIEDSKKS